MYRSAMDKLKAWKNKEDRKPLVLMGARQVGKTWLMKEFGKEEYAKVNITDGLAHPLYSGSHLRSYHTAIPVILSSLWSLPRIHSRNTYKVSASKFLISCAINSARFC